ncbi:MULTISPECIES: universal stress protein [Lysobacter]|uniref:universal stress protein n=1 Tax=Lysobacter TaxID=68 RepID=UPI001F3E8D78|nr:MULTISPECIES: universal stress protein [Lysobacter]UJB21668.1 universal stress protein [Lysobacter capsici]UJQ29215.1 universal stress protein [Lysobacter gummosus]
MRIVIAIDGSEAALRAVRHAIKLAGDMKEPPELHLLYADEPLMRSVALSLGLEGAARYHAENGDAAMRKARAMLKRAKADYEEHLSVGDPAATILKFAKSNRCDLIVMGSHGRSALKNLLLGSVTAKVICNCTVPLTVVR